MIAYLDSSTLIYLIEGAEPFAGRVRAALDQLAGQHGALSAAVGRLSLLECRVKPARDGAADILARFDAFFARPDLSWVELSREVIELATEIRVRHRLRTPDALQAACCLQLGERHIFITGDAAFKKVGSLNVRLLH